MKNVKKISETGKKPNNDNNLKELITEKRPLILVPKREVINIDEQDFEEDKENLTKGGKMGLIRIREPEEIGDTFDITVGKKIYRVFVNKKKNKTWFNEIVSYDYDGRGTVLLKSPAEVTKGGFLRTPADPINQRIFEALTPGAMQKRSDKEIEINKLEARGISGIKDYTALYIVVRWSRKTRDKTLFTPPLIFDFQLFFKFQRTHITQTRMPPDAIVIALDIAEDFRAGLFD
jgi:hypothetical protein